MCRVIFLLWGLFWEHGKGRDAILIILGEVTCQMLSWLIMTFIGQLDIQQNGLTTIRAITFGWRKWSWCSFTSRLVPAKQCLHLVFSEHVRCYITPVEAWESSSLVAGRRRFSQPYRASSQPSPRWHLQGTCPALTIFFLAFLAR